MENDSASVSAAARSIRAISSSDTSGNVARILAVRCCAARLVIILPSYAIPQFP
jgi:hypothetical protein